MRANDAFIGLSAGSWRSAALTAWAAEAGAWAAEAGAWAAEAGAWAAEAGAWAAEAGLWAAEGWAVSWRFEDMSVWTCSSMFCITVSISGTPLLEEGCGRGTGLTAIVLANFIATCAAAISSYSASPMD